MRPLTPRQRTEFRRFRTWCDFHGIALPCTGDDAAEYLLTMLEQDHHLDDIKLAADSIIAHFEEQRAALDQVPIRAAVAIADAQLETRTIQ